MNFLRRPFRYRYDSVALYLIGINIAVFFLQETLPRLFSFDLTSYSALNPVLVIHYRMIWQFVTYMFTHGGISHLVFNMLALFVFGSQVERRTGSSEFLLYYLITGILAGIFSFLVYWFTGTYQVFLLGASGAVFAVQLAYAVLFPDSVVFLWGIIPLRAPVMVLGFTGLELFFQISGQGSGVAHLTHLAGFAFGWLYFMVRFGANPWKMLTRR
ncbi:MAG: rhomboid family intramembrane serine protease [Treponema sp.]|jgi:membrane associated rhomboid family serine protease|nr:rhomboid family intramembrane serine protease [Treponema sp.]